MRHWGGESPRCDTGGESQPEALGRGTRAGNPSVRHEGGESPGYDTRGTESPVCDTEGGESQGET